MNKFVPTLSIYISGQFLIAFLIVLFGIMGLIMLFDLIELVRRSVSADSLGLITLLALAGLKLPHTLQDVLPFIVMIATMLALFRLARNSELVVMRSAGVSVWQFLAPTIAVVAALGLFNLIIFNSISTSLYQSYKQLEERLLLNRENTLNIGVGGLWLRENSDNAEKILHSHVVTQNNNILSLSGVSIFNLDKEGRFIRRYEAQTGELLAGFLRLERVWESAPQDTSQFHEELFLPISISIDQVYESFSVPETLSFWELPQFINFAQDAGFSALPHQVYWHSLLAMPFFLCAMVLVASVFYLKTNNRLGGWTQRALAGLGTGFMLYFFSRLTYAIGLSGILPALLAAWAPTIVAGALGLTYLFYEEDG